MTSFEIHLHKINKSYGSLRVLQDFSAEFHMGNNYWLRGPNGQGKSTLLKIIIQILKADSGKIELCLADNLDQTAARFMLQWMGQEGGLYMQKTAMQHMKLRTQLYGHKVSDTALKEQLKQAGLGRFCDRPVREFSGGMKKRLLLASVFAVPSLFYLLDEPTEGLDQQGVLWFQQLVKQKLDSGAGLIIVNHHAEQMQFVPWQEVVLGDPSGR